MRNCFERQDGGGEDHTNPGKARRRGSYSCFSRSVNYMFFPNHSTQLISGMEQHEESQYVERSPVSGSLKTH